MPNIKLTIAAALPLLLGHPSVAQNPCGYAFSITGQQLFEEHCAGCHGVDGKGEGTLASHQQKPPADLTAITKQNKGE